MKQRERRKKMNHEIEDVIVFDEYLLKYNEAIVCSFITDLAA